MDAFWEVKKEAVTPEEIIARINKVIEEWAAEEKAEAEKKTTEGA